jgi:hypothetical protein
LGVDATALALATANSIGTPTTLDTMIAYQAAILHKVFVETTAAATLEKDIYEKVALLNAAARFADVFRNHAAALQRHRVDDEPKAMVTINVALEE